MAVSPERKKAAMASHQADGHGATQKTAPASAESTTPSSQMSPPLELDAQTLALLEAPDAASLDGPTALSIDVIDLEETLEPSGQLCAAQNSCVEISGGDSAQVSILTLLLEQQQKAHYAGRPEPAAAARGKTAPTASGKKTRQRTAKRPLEPNQCAYRNGLCKKPRTLKSNGAMHSLCEQHRRRSLDNQMRFDQKQRVRRLCEQLQLQPNAPPAVVDTQPPRVIWHPTSDAARQMKGKHSPEQATNTRQQASGSATDQDNSPSTRLQVYII